MEGPGYQHRLKLVQHAYRFYISELLKICWSATKFPPNGVISVGSHQFYSKAENELKANLKDTLSLKDEKSNVMANIDQFTDTY